MITVKQNDTHTIIGKVNMDLTGCTVRWLARLKKSTAAPILLASTITNAAQGLVAHNLTGTLAVGVYDTEIEVNQGGVLTTFPNEGYEQIRVMDDLDA